MEKIGIIGSGVMGLTVAQRLLGAGIAPTVYDVSAQALAKARKLGTQVGRSLSEVTEKSEIILMFLPGPAEVIDCMTSREGLLDAMRPGGVIADMSTSDPGTSARMAKQAGKKKIGYVDAPVLGRPATVGQWALPVGGKKKDLERCRPVFQLFAAKIFHVGPPGAGHKIKLLNQLMFGAINAMTAEMMAIAERVGIPPGQLFEIITASQAGTISNLFKELGRRIAGANYKDPTFTVDLLVKDIKLAVQMAKENHAPPILARSVEIINEISQAQGLGDQDTAMMWKSYRRIWAGRTS